MKNVETPNLQERLLDGFERIAVVMRSDSWRQAAPSGLNPAQGAILRVLVARPAGLRVRALAEHLGVRQPTVTDSVLALERKDLVRRHTDPTDARATIVKAMPGALAEPAAKIRSQAAAALADLTEVEQIGLLKTLIKLIRSLQLHNAIPPQRMCVTCKYFRPNAHPETEAPHHCAYVDAPFGDRALRLDCAEHEPAGMAEVAHNWDRFLTAPPCQEARP